MMSKEAQLSSSKAKQSVLNLTSLGKRTATGEMKIVESKTLDSTIASFIYENALSFNVADSPSLALVGMRVLSQVISASSCERNWSAHGHIQSEVRNRLAPATTEKLVYIYSNRKAVAAAACDDELKMFTWDNE